MTQTLHIYTRVSTSVQEEEGTSLETQKELGIKCATKHGWDYKIWNEGGQSSSKEDLANRPVLMDLLNEIEDGTVQHVYVWNTDRLSRNLQTWGMIRFKLIKNDVRLHTPTGEQILSDPQTNMLLGILSEISQYDNAIRTERFRLGKLHRIRQGGWKGGEPPYGYELIDSRLSPHPEEKEWVKFIYEKYADKWSIRDIRKELQANGVVTRRGKTSWGDRTLELILEHTHYEGFWYFKDKKLDEPIRVECPKILDDELVARVRVAKSKRTRNSRVSNSNEKHFYLLRGLLKCEHCGLTFSGRISPKHSVYYCPRKERNFRASEPMNCENKRYLRIPETDAMVWEVVTKTLSKSHLFKETFKNEVLDTNENYQRQSDRLKKLKRKQRKLETEISDIKEAVIKLETDKILKKRNPEEIEKILTGVEEHRLSLLLEQKEVQGAIDGIHHSRSWTNWVQQFSKKVEELDTLLPSEKREFLENTITEVRVETLDKQTNRLHIEFLTPVVEDELEWRNPEDKSKGYDLIDGNLLKSVDFDVGKRLPLGC